VERRWWVWSLAVSFLFYEYYLRVFPSVMVTELMRDFTVGAGMLGTLSSMYFYAYAPMQIPVGLLMDRYGARRLLTLASLVCGLGGLLFAAAQVLSAAELGRILMGLGSAFGFVGMTYVCSHWFEARRLALLVGVGNSIGMCGAIVGEGPLSIAVSAFGWRGSVTVLSLFAFVLAAAIFLVVRTEPRSITEKMAVVDESRDFVGNLKQVAAKWRSWANALAALFFFMTTAAFASLWGVPFLVQAYGYDGEVASFATSMIFVGWVVGGPVIGFWSDRLGRRLPFLVLTSFLAGLAMLAVIYATGLPPVGIYALLFTVGVLSSAQLLNFCRAIEINPHYCKGTAIAFTNFFVAVGAALMQPLVGYLLEWHWHGTIVDGVPTYTTSDYQFALLVFPASFGVGLLLNLVSGKEEHRKSKPRSRSVQ